VDPFLNPLLNFQDKLLSLSSFDQEFRLRQLIHVGAQSVGINGQSFKLQFVDKGQKGTCTSPEGTYADVTTLTPIAYNNNPTPVDGSPLTANAMDPIHGFDTAIPQTYEESNNFSNSMGPIAVGQDGKWDFSLKHVGFLPEKRNYCLRIVKSDGTLLDTYTIYPVVITPHPPQLVKQVWENNPSALAPLATSSGNPPSTLVPSGYTIVFLIFIINLTDFQLTDVRFEDILDVSPTGFSYVSGSLVRTVIGTGAPSSTALNKIIFDATAPGTGTALTDATGTGDVASFCTAGTCPGPAPDRMTVGTVPGQSNGTLNIPTGKTFAIRFKAVKK
jgi:hypothetical protein